MSKEIMDMLGKRAVKRYCEIKASGVKLPSVFALAGGSMAFDFAPNDYDIYVPENVVLKTTDWAQTTYAFNKEIGGLKFQIINSPRWHGKATVEAFHFSHCQVAAVFDFENEHLDVVCTDNFLLWAEGKKDSFFTLPKTTSYHYHSLEKYARRGIVDYLMNKSLMDSLPKDENERAYG